MRLLTAALLLMPSTAMPGLGAETPAPQAATDADIERLVERLDHDDADERERATRALETLGDRVLPALLRARDCDKPEVQLRATRLIARLQREADLKALEARQRPHKLRLVTVEAVDVPLGDVLRSLSDQTGLALAPEKPDAAPKPRDAPPAVVDLARRVSLRTQDTPLIQVLHRLGLGRASFSRGRSCEVRPEAQDGTVTYIDGACFRMHTRPWLSRGIPAGTVVHTEALQDFVGELEWDVVGIRTDRDEVLETCARHSPEQVYYPTPISAAPRVTIRGLRRWYCDVPVELVRPTHGETWRAGGWTLTICWPEVQVHSDRPIPAHAMQKTLDSSDIRVEYLPGAGPQGGGGDSGDGSAGKEIKSLGAARLRGAAARSIPSQAAVRRRKPSPSMPSRSGTWGFRRPTSRASR